jgi:hypothetical protein
MGRSTRVLSAGGASGKAPGAASITASLSSHAVVWDSWQWVAETNTRGGAASCLLGKGETPRRPARSLRVAASTVLATLFAPVISTTRHVVALEVEASWF